MACFVYILRCADNTYYTGWSNDPARRLAVHSRGQGAKYTRCRLPVTLVYVEECADKSTALKREYAIKQMTRTQKQQLIDRWGGLVE